MSEAGKIRSSSPDWEYVLVPADGTDATAALQKAFDIAASGTNVFIVPYDAGGTLVKDGTCPDGMV